MKTKILSFLIIPLALSCGTSKSSTTNPLVGTWKHGDCQPSVLSLASSYYSKSTVVFTASDVQYTEVLYSDSACLTDVETIVNASGTYLTSPTDAKNIDFQWKSISLTPKSTESAKNFSDFSLCGLGNWTVDTSQSVKAKTCQSWGRPFANDAKVLQTYEIEAGKIWLGSTIYLQSESRPSSLPDRAFEKI